jgi:hypothetical protein
MGTASATTHSPPVDITHDELPEWALALLAVGGTESPWVTVLQSLPYLPCDRNAAYLRCERYDRRVTRERQRRGSYLLSVDALDARKDELPCEKSGHKVLLPKRRLIERLLGCRVLWPKASS